MDRGGTYAEVQRRVMGEINRAYAGHPKAGHEPTFLSESIAEIEASAWDLELGYAPNFNDVYWGQDVLNHPSRQALRRRWEEVLGQAAEVLERLEATHGWLTGP
jgi:hypothetical protein